LIDYNELLFQAESLRATLSIPIDASIDVFAVIARTNSYTLIEYPFSDQISGMSIQILEGNRIIAVNMNDTLGRQRFTCAHELYHLNFQKGFTSVVCPSGFTSKNEVEKSANSFASYFLVPSVALNKQIYERGLNKRPFTSTDIIDLEQFFGMSHQAMLFRLRNSRLITEEECEQFKTDGARALALKLGYDNSLYKPRNSEKKPFLSGEYIRLANELLKDDKVSQGYYNQIIREGFRSDLLYSDITEIHLND
jgi:Zn-dependent peptidase ImmA (M78 family)